jgi:phage terminase Nu1 subunit (DNA packaging protein)
MKNIDFTRPCSQRFFANMIGVSDQAVSDMIRRDVIVSGQPLNVWLKTYCSHLREQAAGRAATGGLDLATERAKLAKVQHERIEMQNAVARREYGPIDALEFGLTDLMVRVASQLDTIPGKLKIASDRLTAADLDIVTGVIAMIRNDIASMEIEWFDDQADEDDKST